ncbi:MAG: hypothetical protein WB696_02180 [Chthoniobacterales bacterium]
MSCPELLNRLHDFWRDFNTINRWKFPELSPASLQQWLDFNLGQVDYAEFARAEWMWGRKPRSPLGKSMSVYILLVFVGLLLLLFPSFGILLAAAWYLAMFIAIAHDAVRSARWRREYEVSIVRVIRSSGKVK